MLISFVVCFFFFFQAEDGIRDAQESRGLGDVYKRQVVDGKKSYSSSLSWVSTFCSSSSMAFLCSRAVCTSRSIAVTFFSTCCSCLLYTSDAADEEDSVDLGGRRIIKKKKK
eukprot:TRINITY_DN28340_c0_g1_i1.p1 TRINITY_DN28340_c0_g1~~TRINITY_DN28340_c0_g1_i1.p1  ORF type:complete len:112 (-),score=45.59 TRINITY_DN28340_c0_g1_i1:66-401(-)